MTTTDGADVTRRFHGDDEFSTAAFEQTATQQRVLDRARIERSLREDGPATCETLEARLGMSHQTCSARVSELRKAGALVEVGKEPTASGRSARVHGLADDLEASA